MNIKIITFTPEARALSAKINPSGVLLQRYDRNFEPALRHTDCARFVQQAIVDCDALLWIGDACEAETICIPYFFELKWEAAVWCIHPETLTATVLRAGKNKEIAQKMGEIHQKIQEEGAL